MRSQQNILSLQDLAAKEYLKVFSRLEDMVKYLEKPSAFVMIECETSDNYHYITMVELPPDEIPKDDNSHAFDPKQILQKMVTKEYLLISKILTHIVRGELVEAEGMLKIASSDPNPNVLSKLLTSKLTVIDHAYRKTSGTALELAIAQLDVDGANSMAEMIMRYLALLPNGDRITAKQILEILPVNWQDREIIRIKQDNTAFNNVKTAFEHATHQEDVQLFQAITGFTTYLNSFDKIEYALHFNVKLLIDALNYYLQNYVNNHKNRNDYKNKLFWIHVVGSIQAKLPACFAQAICQGLDNVISDTEETKLVRSLKFKYSPIEFFHTNIITRANQDPPFSYDNSDPEIPKQIGIGRTCAVMNWNTNGVLRKEFDPRSNYSNQIHPSHHTKSLEKLYNNKVNELNLLHYNACELLGITTSDNLEVTELHETTANSASSSFSSTTINDFKNEEKARSINTNNKIENEPQTRDQNSENNNEKKPQKQNAYCSKAFGIILLVGFFAAQILPMMTDNNHPDKNNTPSI